MGTEPSAADDHAVVRSLSLADIRAEHAPHGSGGVARRAVSAASVLGLVAAGALAAYFVLNGPEDSNVLALKKDEPVHTGSISANAAPSEAAPFVVPQPAPERPAPLTARLPKARPENPTIAFAQYEDRRADAPPPVYHRAPDPCMTLHAMTAHLPFRVHCVPERRYGSVPPRYHPYGDW